MSRDARVTVTEAADRMGVNPQFLRMGLRAGKFPFGTAVQMPGGRWSYYINPVRFERYIQGLNMGGAGLQRSKPARDPALAAAVEAARDARPLEPTRRRPRTRDELRELVDGCLPGRRYEVRSAYRRRGGVEEWLGGVR